MTSEVQQKAIRDSEDMASAMRTRPTSSASAPNLPGLGGGSSSIVRQAGADADSRYHIRVPCRSLVSCVVVLYFLDRDETGGGGCGGTVSVPRDAT